MTYRAIEKKFGYSMPTISLWWHRYCETGGVDDAPRSGRPLKLTDAQAKAVGRSLKHKNRGSLRTTAKYLTATQGVTITKNMVASTAKRIGLVYRLRKTKPLLTPKVKKARPYLRS